MENNYYYYYYYYWVVLVSIACFILRKLTSYRHSGHYHVSKLEAEMKRALTGSRSAHIKFSAKRLEKVTLDILMQLQKSGNLELFPCTPERHELSLDHAGTEAIAPGLFRYALDKELLKDSPVLMHVLLSLTFCIWQKHYLNGDEAHVDYLWLLTDVIRGNMRDLDVPKPDFTCIGGSKGIPPDIPNIPSHLLTLVLLLSALKKDNSFNLQKVF